MRHSHMGFRQCCCGLDLLIAVVAFIILSLLFYMEVASTVKSEAVSGSMEYLAVSERGEIERSGATLVTIDQAHSKTLPHRGIWIVVFDPSKQHTLFLQRTRDHVTCGDSWTFVGEHAKPFEEYFDVAIRGLREELGLQLRDLLELKLVSEPIRRLHLHYPISNRTDNQWTHAFVAVVRNISTVRPDSSEAASLAWVPIDTAVDWISDCQQEGRCRGCQDATDIYSSHTDLSGRPLTTRFASFTSLLVFYFNLATKHLHSTNNN